MSYPVLLLITRVGTIGITLNVSKFRQLVTLLMIFLSKQSLLLLISVFSNCNKESIYSLNAESTILQSSLRAVSTKISYYNLTIFKEILYLFFINTALFSLKFTFVQMLLICLDVHNFDSQSGHLRLILIYICRGHFIQHFQKGSCLVEFALY